MTFEVIYVWPDGREEVRYRRPSGSPDAIVMKSEIDRLNGKIGGERACYYREIEKEESDD